MSTPKNIYRLFDLTVLGVVFYFLPSSSLLPLFRHRHDYQESSCTIVDGSPTAHQCELFNMEDDHATYKIGAAVEVYDQKIHPTLAFAAQINAIYNTTSSNTVSYDVRIGFGSNRIYKIIPHSSIRRMIPFESGANVMCDGGDDINTKLEACTVISHNAPTSIVLVSIKGEDLRMPVSRIRRRIAVSDDESSNKRKELIPVQSIVQVKQPGIHSYSAIVTGHWQYRSNQVRYHVINTITKSEVKNIQARYVQISSES